MRIGRKAHIIILILTQPLWSLGQQTMQFTQYVFNGLSVNPAYAGYKDEWNFAMSYRTQWTGFDGSPKTATLSVDGLADPAKKNVGIGVLFTSDRLGPQITNSAYFNYAYRLQLDDEDTRRLSFGMAVGGLQYSLDASLFKANDVVDNSIPQSNDRMFAPDVRVGAYYYSEKMYIGFSGLNLLSSSLKSSFNNFALQRRHFYLTGGMLLTIADRIDVKPSVLIKEDFKGPTSIDVCNYIAFDKRLWLGASWRTGINLWHKSNLDNNLKAENAFTGIMQIFFDQRYRFGYSYDVAINELSGYQNGTHEISLGFMLNGKKDRVLSPRFF